MTTHQAVTLSLSLLACSLPAQVTYYSAALHGDQQVPPVASPGAGFGIVRLQEPANIVRIFVHYYGLTAAPTAAHLHQAPAGINGGVIVPLASGLAPGTLTATAPLTPGQVTALKSAGTYINVHTAANPGGELRGQVVEPTSTRFTATLDGAQQVPPSGSAASGTANAYLHEPDHRLVYCVDTAGLVAISAAHLHAAPSGTNGGVMFPLIGSAGSYCGVSRRLTAAEVATLLADGTYLNIHTGANPGGEIRGQLLKSPGHDYTAALDGAQQVPPNATAGVGAAALHIDKAGIAHVTTSFTGLTGPPIAAHIHNAPSGSNGGVTVPLALSGGQFVATFTPSTAQLAQLRAGNWYVNIHTGANPGGEIRGQLSQAALPTTFGPNCPTSTGSRPEIGATGFAGLGSAVEIEVYGGPPSTVGFLALGFNRDTIASASLPVHLGLIGVNAPCFIMLNSLATLLTFTDGNGCATRSIGFGFVPSFVGLPVYGEWILLDAAANPAGIVTSNALSMALQ